MTDTTQHAATEPDLTPMVGAVLAAIRAAIVERGYPPSMKEIGRAVGLVSVSSVSYQLGVLAQKGYIRRDYATPRSIVVLDRDGNP